MHPVARITPEGQNGVVSGLADRECVPCRGGVPPLEGAELERMLAAPGGEWRVVDAHHLFKEYRFQDFAEALAFTNRVGELAETQGHRSGEVTGIRNRSSGWPNPA